MLQRLPFHIPATLVALALSSSPLHAQAWEVCSPLQTFLGETPGDNFGWIIDSISDLDGDDIRDCVVTTPFHDSMNGKVYVYSSGSGLLLHEFEGSNGERLGNYACELGDLNGDGLPEICAGAPNFGAGSVYVFSGSDGALLLTLAGEAAGDNFGIQVERAGDTNEDGLDDILVGAINNDEGANNGGKVYLYSGANGALLHSWIGTSDGALLGRGLGSASDLNGDGRDEVMMAASGVGEVWLADGATGQVAHTFLGEATSGTFGSAFLETVGDLDGDGVSELYLANWANSSVATGAGKAWIHSGATFALLFELSGESNGDNFGGGHPAVGDLDGDGVGDLMFCAWSHSGGGNAAGQVRLHSGVDGRLLGRYTGDQAGEWFGSDCAGLGDVDGDGHPDFLVSAASFSSGNPGAAYVISGAPAPPRNVCSSSPNSTGSSARMTYRRSTSLATNDFRLRVEGAVPGETGVFFFGSSPQNLPFGDGILCIDAPLTRLDPVTISNQGSRQVALDFTDPTLMSLTAGADNYFQFWYRDPGAGASGFTLSDALKVTFCP